MELARPRTSLDDAHYGDFVQLRDHTQLLRLVRWLREVEGVLPADEFEISEDYTVTPPCRPSEVELSALERLAAEPPKRRRKRARSSPVDAEAPEDEVMMATARDEVDQVEKTLEEARRQFARWRVSRG